MPEAFLAFLLLVSEIQDRESLRFVHSAEQGYDSSCGLSALVCLMRTYWDEPADELSLAAEFLADKIALGDFTVSFADLAAILTARGFTVAAYKMDYDQLRKAAERYPPLLVHYERPEGHFALVLAADEDGPVVADPASGTGALDRGAFMERWSGYVLLAALPSRSPRKDILAEARSLARGRLAILERSSRIFERGGFR